MDASETFSLPYIMPSQAQKHVTHNEAIRMIDALLQAAVESRNTTTPPDEPTLGQSYIVPEDADDLWTGRVGEIATFQDGAWAYYAAVEGAIRRVIDEDVLVIRRAGVWEPLQAVLLTGVGMFGLNATPDPVNRLALSSPASLFNHEGAGHHLKINKASVPDTASILFQTGFSGRAEFGLTGDDHWHVKVSADGTTWREALTVRSDTGRVGINTPTPTQALEVAGAMKVATGGNAFRLAGDNYVVMDIQSFRESPSNHAMVIGYAARGTEASPAPCQNGDRMFDFSVRGWNSSAFTTDRAGIQFRATETWSAAANGCDMRFFITQNGSSAMMEALHVAHNGSVRMPAIGTTASAANVFVDSSNSNALLRSTSSQRYKTGIEPIDPIRTEALMAVSPVWYRSTAEADDPSWSWYGFIAEEVAAADPRMVHWSYAPEDFEEVEIVLDKSDGNIPASTEIERQLKPDAQKKPEGVAYERFTAHHHLVIRDLMERVARLEGNKKIA